MRLRRPAVVTRLRPASPGGPIGGSMVPRAEIAMIVMERGRALGGWAVPPERYGAMVLVSLGTCLLAPPMVRYLLGARGTGSGST